MIMTPQRHSIFYPAVACFVQGKWQSVKPAIHILNNPLIAEYYDKFNRRNFDNTTPKHVT